MTGAPLGGCSQLHVGHLVSRPKAKSGPTVWLVRCRAMNSSQRVGLAMNASGDMSTMGQPFMPQPKMPTWSARHQALNFRPCNTCWGRHCSMP